MRTSIVLIAITYFLFLASIFKVPKVKLGCNNIVISKPKFKKLIYLLIDGLRFDGAVPVTKDGLYFNNMTFFHNEELLKTSFLSIAGIPTVTSCRILSMITGTPSNEIQEIMTFFVSESKLDNLPNKFKTRNMHHYGDDLWATAFPILKNRSDCFCGLSKHNNKKIEEVTINKILKDKINDIKFIHLINLDSFGHKYGINHLEMKKELEILNDFINKLYADMDDDTLFVITSDHGVTDEGSHGGVSERELASFCGFYAKDNQKLFCKDPKTLLSLQSDANFEFISRFYKLDRLNTKDDWIEAKNIYKVIHQDDILPTICYYMGVPPPTNTYGNIISHLIQDSIANRLLANQKIELLNSIEGSSTVRELEDDMIFEKINYQLTNQIYSLSSGYYPLLTITSLIVGLAALYQMIPQVKQLSVREGPFIFTTIMVSHSYWSYASEDIFWFFTLLFSKFTVINIISVLFFIKASQRVCFKTDRVDLHIATFNGFPQVLIFVILFFIVKNINIQKKKWEYNKNFINNLMSCQFPILLSILDHFFGMTREDKIFALVVEPSLDTLFSIHFDHKIVLSVLYFFRNLDIADCEGSKHILMSMIPYLVNLEKNIESINYNVFFVLSDKFGSLSNYLGVFAYPIIPRIYIHRLRKPSYTGLLLNILMLFSCFICTWAMKGSLVYSYFFVGRLMFASAFFMIDMIIELLLCIPMMIAPNSKVKLTLIK